uniref:Uncharacterized protein n=1 Tax=Lepeophtheirus salmonis TaxID=72036 RepID=A0A0K2TPF2_LEPSM
MQRIAIWRVGGPGLSGPEIVNVGPDELLGDLGRMAGGRVLLAHVGLRNVCLHPRKHSGQQVLHIHSRIALFSFLEEELWHDLPDLLMTPNIMMELEFLDLYNIGDIVLGRGETSVI